MVTSAIHEVLTNHALARPDANAIIGDNSLYITYSRLSEQVQSLGHRLSSRGIQANNRVAVILPNGPVMAVAFLAVSSFAACAPLNPNYTVDEFEFYLSDLEADAVIVAGDVVDSAVRQAADRLVVPLFEIVTSSREGQIVIELRHDGSEIPAVAQAAACEDIAILLHTSGTTSRPKLVPLTQGNICASARNIIRALELSENDRCLNVMPLFHIHGLIGALLSTIVSGGSIVCTSGFDRDQFFFWLDAFKPTWYSAVPTIHQAIAGQCDETDSRGDKHSLRFIRSSSSALPPNLFRQLEALFGIPVIESYGMTEASHQMASNPLPPKQRRPGSVGLPAGPEIGIMDAEDQLLSAGEIGEVVIKGHNVTSGYENNPEANRHAFSNGWFRTGDQGYLDTDGYLFLSGRLKEVINRGGEKISPREIDEALLEHPNVNVAVAFAIPHATLGEDIAAAVILKPGSTTSESELREFSFRKLANVKIPSTIIIVDEIPKGPSGKLKRIGLSEQFKHHLQATLQTPENDLQTLLAKIWREVLKIERIGIHDNFFVLGGDSITATQVLSRIRSRLRLEFPLDIIFREPTIAGLAILIERSELREDESTLELDTINKVNEMERQLTM